MRRGLSVLFWTVIVLTCPVFLRAAVLVADYAAPTTDGAAGIEAPPR
jgi:hypothetical protein